MLVLACWLGAGVLTAGPAPAAETRLVPLEIDYAANRPHDAAPYYDGQVSGYQWLRPGVLQAEVGSGAGPVPFEVLDPRQNHGRSVVITQGQRNGFPATVRLYPSRYGVRRVFLLGLAGGWASKAAGGEAGEVVARFADGTEERHPLRFGFEVDDWTRHTATGARCVASAGPNGTGAHVDALALDLAQAHSRFLTELRVEDRDAEAALRYMTRTHVTGDLACANGRKWGHHWQSAWWTRRLVAGARLIWNQLGDAERDGIRRVLVSEADRHLSRQSPGEEFGNTRSEENAWDSEVLAWAACLYPEQEHAAAWKEKACEFFMNSLSTASDKTDAALVDGRPVQNWVTTVNLHSDFTIENHGAYQFCYMACPLHSLTWAHYACTSTGRPPPQALFHHFRDVWEVIRRYSPRDQNSTCAVRRRRPLGTRASSPPDEVPCAGKMPALPGQQQPESRRHALLHRSSKFLSVSDMRPGRTPVRSSVRTGTPCAA